MNIGILLTSNDESAFAARFPNDGEKFRMLLAPARPGWSFEVVSVKDDIFPKAPDSFDGYVITGSPASVYDPLSWIGRLIDFTRSLDKLRIPTVAVCLGHQIVAEALGGKVEKASAGWGFGTATTQFFEQRPWMNPQRGELSLYAGHKDQVVRLPNRATLIGRNDFCPNAAFEIGGHIMTTQYHPEMTAEFMTELVDEMGDALSVRQAAAAREQLRWKEDGVLYAEWIVRFLEMAR